MSTEVKKLSHNLYSNASFGGGGGGGGGNDRDSYKTAQATPPRPSTMDPANNWAKDVAEGHQNTLVGGKVINGSSPLVGQNPRGATQINH